MSLGISEKKRTCNMCFFNNFGCGCRTGSCFSCSSVTSVNNSCGCACGAEAVSSLPYYVNPFGWYTCGEYAVLALVPVATSQTTRSSGCSGCC